MQRGLKRKEFGLLNSKEASLTRGGRMRKLMKGGKVTGYQAPDLRAL